MREGATPAKVHLKREQVRPAPFPYAKRESERVTSMKYKTILFDLDGTLLYTVRDLADAVNHALEKHGFPTHTEERIARMVGNGVSLLVARALPLGYDTPGFEDVLADFRAYYSAHCEDNTHPYAGVVGLLRELKARSCHTAVVTNKYQTAAEDLVRRFFGDSVDVIVGDAPGRRCKPEPDAPLAALEALGAGRDGAVYVGDTEVDRQTAENTGLPFICVSWGYRSLAELQAMEMPVIARDAGELLALLED